MKKRGDDGEENDQDLWNYVTRGIKAYKPSNQQQLLPTKTRIRKITSPAAPKPPLFFNAPAVLPGKGFDRSTETKLRRGQLPLEGRLDLHGKTQAEAYELLRRFIHSAVAQEKRTILVITGKGQRFEGILRQMVPQWLADPALAQYIVAVTPAQPKDGGTGAFYLRLRKSRQ